MMIAISIGLALQAQVGQRATQGSREGRQMQLWYSRSDSSQG